MEHLQLPMGFVAGVRRLPGNGPTHPGRHLHFKLWQVHTTSDGHWASPRSCPGRLDGFTHEPHLPAPTWTGHWLTGWTTSPPLPSSAPQLAPKASNPAFAAAITSRPGLLRVALRPIRLRCVALRCVAPRYMLCIGSEALLRSSSPSPSPASVSAIPLRAPLSTSRYAALRCLRIRM
ncbi:hypothetical protein CSOJ01_13121 [Colletotrichum sojae]|uniref:Uncharacterized protein n=1 Tax=Colletotrichum sojae TaxID=2175907 RepID=A0A8H6IU36_9PEZI|nr:hypothetical protein CSOJ01_13121 [Colletotrichum sojae]